MENDGGEMYDRGVMKRKQQGQVRVGKAEGLELSFSGSLHAFFLTLALEIYKVWNLMLL
ncbi:hypothetical protein SLEP1_g21782 [Rubroshorea leprosula]|uniref:Uncharacterized protein n=1 Tax=Rubroshorea leprosula TaxID=152421 RepID=A0AAV5JGE2_9ROSI|nr:hypothetical protein SLEP1_g21782 [Rubroshorea leprosula]